jgi:dTDP-glucose pyrophosphorylase
MKDWKSTLLSSESSIMEALEAIERGGIQISFVVDSADKLMGSVSDGDIRRGLLHGLSLNDSVDHLMKKDPVSASAELSDHAVLKLMANAGVRVVPLVNPDHSVVGLEVLEDSASGDSRENPVLIMAGGMGTRLLPLTENCPKPLLRVNGKPILEIILKRLVESGFHNFYFSVNYKSQMIKSYFKDGEKWGAKITYLDEIDPLGTAGAISLVPDKIDLPMVVINGDVITKVNANHLLKYHDEHNYDATMCIRQYEYEVPFGVVDVSGQEFLDVQEKPIKRCFVNAGIYVLSPKALVLIPEKERFNMTDLFLTAKGKGMKSGVYPVTEYWVDVGRHDDLNRVRREIGID